LIPLAGNVVASFATEWTGAKSWLVVPAVGMGVAMVTALVQAYGSARAPSPRPQPRRDEPWPGHVDPSRRYGGREPRRGTPLPIALVVAVLVLGVGGWALAQGVRYGVGYVTGNEPGAERLRQQATQTADGLTLTVESVEQTAHFTRVRLLARNASDNLSLTLPLFKTCKLRGDGATLEADAFRSRWTEELSPGSVQRGTVTFGGHLPDSVRVAELTFSPIFSFPVGGRPFERGPGFITVKNLRLGPA
jgi:hypothetical protein